MQAGRLDERISIQTLSTAQNAYGEPVESWASSSTVWADVRPARGQERFVSAGDQLLATLTHRVTIRYLDGLSPVNHRLLWGTTVLDIESVVDPTGRMAEMTVMCREVVTAGTIGALVPVAQARLPYLPPMLRLASV